MDLCAVPGLHLTVSIGHNTVDGASPTRFASSLRDLIEDPDQFVAEPQATQNRLRQPHDGLHRTEKRAASHHRRARDDLDPRSADR